VLWIRQPPFDVAQRRQGAPRGEEAGEKRVGGNQLVGAAATNLRADWGLTDFTSTAWTAAASAASTASAAASFRSRCGSVRGAPVWSSHTSPAAAPHVAHGTEDICSAVSFLVFTTT